MVSLNLKVRAGTSVSAESNGWMYDVAKFTKHEDYVRRKAQHDIAILELKEEIIFDNFKRCIFMFGANEKLTHRAAARSAGWGVTEHNPKGRLENGLKSLEFSVLDKKSCVSIWGACGKNFFEENEVCAAGAKGSLSFGDSGGPLVVGNKLAGVAARANNMQPDVFTEVAKFRAWIDSIVGPHACDIEPHT